MRYIFIFLFTLFVFSDCKSQTNTTHNGKIVVKPDTSNVFHILVLTETQACDSDILAKGIHINGRYGNILSLQLNEENLVFLTTLSCVKHIETSTKANSARLKNDIERNSTSVDKVQDGLNNLLPKNYNGKGVIVGIVDVGFQCNNPTFYTSDGKNLRISRYWYQYNTNGPAPNGFSYGTEYTDTNFIQMVNDVDGSHGTHVAGIAAGSGFTTPGLQYRGVAPEAELVFVSIKYTNDTLQGSTLGDYIVANPTIIDAFKYIFDYAESVGKPAVINLSWGMHTGPHDGNSLFDQACDALVGPGKILVGSSGNEGDNPMHIHHKFNNDTISTLMIENGRQFRQRESVYSDFWGSKNSNFSLKVQFIDTNKVLIYETPFISSLSDSLSLFQTFTDNSLFKVVIDAENKTAYNQKPNITVMADHQNQRKYAIVVTITSDTSLVHGWNSGATKEWTSGSFRNQLNQIDFSNTFINGNSDYTAGENGGTSKSMISVGAYAARSSYTNVKGNLMNDSSYVLPGSLAKFSSRGPTVDGRIKPDITAPGFDVPSSTNNLQFASWMLDRTLLKTVFRNDTQYWIAFNGTSMAAPHVTGIVALLLQVNPLLNSEQIRSILTETAVVDQATGNVPNTSYGYGKVDAYSAVIKALQSSKLNAQNTGPEISIFPNPFSNSIQIIIPQISGDATIEIISSDGRLVYSTSIVKSNDIITISSENLADGLYFIRFQTGGELFVYKLLKIK